MIRIERDNEGITVKFPFNSGYIAKVKTVRGYKWHPEKKYWSIPYSEFEELLFAFSKEKIEIDPSVWFIKLEKELISRKYSIRTVKLYTHYNEEFLRISGKTPYQTSNEDVREYLFSLDPRFHYGL